MSGAGSRALLRGDGQGSQRPRERASCSSVGGRCRSAAEDDVTATRGFPVEDGIFAIRRQEALALSTMSLRFANSRKAPSEDRRGVHGARTAGFDQQADVRRGHTRRIGVGEITAAAAPRKARLPCVSTVLSYVRDRRPCSMVNRVALLVPGLGLIC